MNSTEWENVKVHNQLIYASKEYGVFQVEVVEVDIKIVEEQPTYHYDYPYGKTADTGIIRIKYVKNDVEQVEVQSLIDLMWFTPTTMKELTKAYNEWKIELDSANSYEAVFLQLLNKKKLE